MPSDNGHAAGGAIILRRRVRPRRAEHRPGRRQPWKEIPERSDDRDSACAAMLSEGGVIAEFAARGQTTGERERFCGAEVDPHRTVVPESGAIESTVIVVG